MMNRRDFLKKTAAAGVALAGKSWLPPLRQFGGLVPPGTPLPGALADDGCVVPAALASRSMFAVDNFGIAQVDLATSLKEATDAHVVKELMRWVSGELTAGRIEPSAYVRVVGELQKMT